VIPATQEAEIGGAKKPTRSSRKDKQKAGGMALVVQHLPSKHKALNLNPSTAKKKKEYALFV
jgi:hypothetical protein